MQEKKTSVAHGHRWGEWQFDERRLYLDYAALGYNIRLSPQNLVTQMFNHLRGVAAKTWGTKGVLLDLVQAYNEVFSHSPKFSKPFQSEIAPRKTAWERFLVDVRSLIKEEGTDRLVWNRKLEEALNRFKAD